MKRLEQLKAKLAACRKELEFIEGQLCNERLLELDELAELSPDDTDKLWLQNQKLMTEVIQLEALLEEGK